MSQKQIVDSVLKDTNITQRHENKPKPIFSHRPTPSSQGTDHYQIENGAILSQRNQKRMFTSNSRNYNVSVPNSSFLSRQEHKLSQQPLPGPLG